MNENKFRAWDKRIKKMYYFTLEEAILGKLTPMTPNTKFMNYIGLEDKNGKEIYEDDIMKDFHGNHGVVEFTDGYFYIKGQTWLEVGDLADGEIIGNIHEEKEEKC